MWIGIQHSYLFDISCERSTLSQPNDSSLAVALITVLRDMPMSAAMVFRLGHAFSFWPSLSLTASQTSLSDGDRLRFFKRIAGAIGPFSFFALTIIKTY